jgi:cyclophilin family peptidyl-prolyl cis-trans isomerase
MNAARRALGLWAVCALCIALFVAACGGSRTQSKDSDAGEGEDAALEARVKKGVKPEPDREVAVIETDYGKIVIELYPNIAPGMVARFKQLIKEGFYNGTTFHRVNPEAGLIQGGDPLSKDDDPTNDGDGDSPYPNVTAEFSDLPYERGTVGAARRSEANMTDAEGYDTANCQFFITLKRQDAFDRRYTVFGRVIEGLNTADVIASAPVEPGTERPAEKIIIKSITLQKKP